MARHVSEPLRTRVSPAFLEVIQRYAVDHGHVGVDGSPNVSAAVRELLSIALDKGDGITIAMAARENVRAELLQSLYFLVSERYQDIANELR